MEDPCSILVVDDDVTSLSGILELLRDQRYRVTGAATLEAATRLLDAFLFDLLIVDLRLGRSNGLELIARARREQSALPVIVITGYPSDAPEHTVGRIGADYLVKPIDPGHLLFLVRSRVHQGELRDYLPFLDP